jgi:Flp pilus assembly protein TadD
LALVAKSAHPEDAYISDTLGYVHYLRGSYSLALTQFRQAVEQRPDYPTFRYHLAVALNADGQTDKAIEELKQAMKLEGTFPEKKEAGALLAALEKE